MFDKDKLLNDLKDEAAIAADLTSESAKKLDYELHLSSYIRNDRLSKLLTILFTSGVIDSGETDEIRQIMEGEKGNGN